MKLFQTFSQFFGARATLENHNAEPEATRGSHLKNLIFILADQHRHDGWSRYQPEVRTPSLEHLASEGTYFDHCFATSQPCVPSRACLLTGRYAEVHGLWNNASVLPDYLPTWPDHLSNQGFQTVAVGRTHHIDRGFDNVIRVSSGRSYPRNCHDPEMQMHWRPDAVIEPSPADGEDYYEMRITRTAIELLEEMARSGQRFALNIGYLAPHPALTPPREFWELYDGVSFPLPDQVPPPADLIKENLFRSMTEVTPEQHQRIARGYYAMVSLIDRCIGKVLEAVEDLGMADDTLIVATSDHGEQLGHRRLYSKCYGYEPSVRIPLFVRAPGRVSPGVTQDALIEHLDLLPMIFEALDVEPMPTSGRSFWSLCTGDAAAQHREVIYSSYAAGQIFRDRTHKWIHRKAPDGGFVDEIYDLTQDPGEQINIVGQAESQTVKSRFARHLQELSISDFRNRIEDTHLHCPQPPLIPYFTT